MNHFNQVKIGIVHDAFMVNGGAERLTYYLSNIFPDAPIYTSIYHPKKSFPELKQKKIITHKLNRFIPNERVFKQLYPIWFQYFYQQKFSNFDIIISSSTYLAKFISPTKNTKHVCYMHSPFRFLWKRESYSSDSLPFNSPTMGMIDKAIPFLQKHDYKLTQRIDQIITNSNNMKTFIHDVYQKESQIVHPPVDCSQYHINQPQDFYLCVGRLLSYKKFDIAIKACNQLKKKLIIVGDGFERINLEKIAGPNVQFVGRVDEHTLKELYSTCKALIFPGIEDFGMVPVEVQASGRPVIAFKAGGALETIVKNKTGVFFTQQTPEALIESIIKFENLDFSTSEIQKHAQKFDLSVFEQQIKSIILRNTN